MNRSWRLIEDPPCPGEWNMAADELLLEQAGGGSAPCLRLYGWDRPTVSLGYFQSLDEMPAAERERCAVVRRPTGGGAILHGRELTYAVAVSREEFEGRQLYDRVNLALLAAVRALGVEAEVRGAQEAQRAQRGPFFCFARAAATDIIARSMKLAGSAQRRRAQGILQHGSLLIETAEPGAIGLDELCESPPTFDDVAHEVIRGFEGEFGAAFERRPLSPAEREEVEAIRRRRYGSRDWLVRGDRKGHT